MSAIEVLKEVSLELKNGTLGKDLELGHIEQLLEIGIYKLQKKGYFKNKKALLALEKPKFVWVFTDENGNVSVFNSKESALKIIRKDKNRLIMENELDEIVFINTYGGKIETKIGKEQEQSYLVKKEVLGGNSK